MGGVLYNLLAEFRDTVLPRSCFEKRLRAVRDFVSLVGERAQNGSRTGVGQVRYSKSNLHAAYLRDQIGAEYTYAERAAELRMAILRFLAHGRWQWKHGTQLAGA